MPKAEPPVAPRPAASHPRPDRPTNGKPGADAAPPPAGGLAGRVAAWRQEVDESFRQIAKTVRGVAAALKKENAHKLFAFTLTVTFVAATLEYLVELRWVMMENGHPKYGFFDAFWWAVVTMTTVGYGDIAPTTHAGRVVGMGLMVSGVVLLSLVTASIASVLVERRIREDRGLERLTMKGHTVLCGWNDNAEEILMGLVKSGSGQGKVVLVNEVEEDMMNSIRFRYKDFGEVRFVRGDFTIDAVLKMSNLSDAASCVILADTSPTGMAKSDERVILAVLTVKSIAPTVKVCVECLDRSNVNHLRRARADEVVVRGKYTGFFLVNAVTAPGVTRAVEELLTFDVGNQIRRQPMPEKCVGKTFGEASAYFREHEDCILIGLISEAPGVDLTDILGGDMSVIDLFIKRKFEEAGEDLSQAAKREDVILNPPNSRIIESWDVAIVVAAWSKLAEG